MPVVHCTRPSLLQGAGVWYEGAAAPDQQTQAAQLPWLGPILQSVMVPMQVGVWVGGGHCWLGSGCGGEVPVDVAKGRVFVHLEHLLTHLGNYTTAGYPAIFCRHLQLSCLWTL